jgi:hypothetical protein
MNFSIAKWHEWFSNGSFGLFFDQYAHRKNLPTTNLGHSVLTPLKQNPISKGSAEVFRKFGFRQATAFNQDHQIKGQVFAY